MKRLLGWRVWFEDGNSFEQTTLDAWKNSPDDGVQIVMRYFEDGTKIIMQGTKWYWLAPHPEGLIFDNDTKDDPASIAARYPGAHIKRGKSIPDAFYRKIMDEAMKSRWDDGN